MTTLGMINQLPKEILTVRQWSYSHSGAALKRPKHSHYTPNGSLDYNTAKQRAGSKLLTGFYVTEEDDYILGDIDHVDRPLDKEYIGGILPISLADILFNHKVYSEVSPSGKGLRFIAKLTPGVKELLDGRYFKNNIPMGQDIEGVPREAQFHIGPPWNTITGNRTPYSSSVISEVDIKQLDEIFKIAYVGDPVGTDYMPPPDIDSDTIPPIAVMIAALHSLPWDGNPRIKRAFKVTFAGEEYSPYEYWLKVLMAMSDYASKMVNPNDQIACLENIVKWSRTDEEGFDSEKEIIVKWKSFMKKTGKVSFHTILSLQYYNTLRWPQCKAPSKAQVEAGMVDPVPLVAQYSNFQAMTQFYNMVLYRDVNTPHKMYLTGDEDVMTRSFGHLDTKLYFNKYFGPWSAKNLIPKFHQLCQQEGFINISHSHIQQNLAIWTGDINRTVDMVRLFFDTPMSKLPPEYRTEVSESLGSDPRFLYSCLDIDYQTDDIAREDALYYRYYKSWLMGMARNIFFPHTMHMNNCVLLLTGAEQIRKTSHFKFILPKFMREERVAFSGHGFSTESAVRDVTKLSSVNNLIVWDEIEQYLTSETESNFKKLIDNNPIKVIDKYEVIESYVKPIAVYGATSNSREFNLSDNGNRRLFHIPVKWVATDKMEDVDWHKIINDLRYEIENSDPNNPPWLLNDAELEYQASLHAKIRSKSSLDLIIEDMFNFNTKFPCPRHATCIDDFNFRTADYLWTISDISNRVRSTNPGMKNFNRKHLLNVLHRTVGGWTDTVRRVHEFTKPRMTIIRGEVNYDGRKKFWMPPLNSEYIKKGYDFDASTYK